MRQRTFPSGGRAIQVKQRTSDGIRKINLRERGYAMITRTIAWKAEVSGR